MPNWVFLENLLLLQMVTVVVLSPVTIVADEVIINSRWCSVDRFQQVFFVGSDQIEVFGSLSACYATCWWKQVLGLKLGVLHDHLRPRILHISKVVLIVFIVINHCTVSLSKQAPIRESCSVLSRPTLDTFNSQCLIDLILSFLFEF